MLLALVPLLALLSGCVVLDGAIGCDFREGGANGAEDRCQERTGAQKNGFDAMCETLGGEAVDGGCPLDGAVAGCRTAAPAGDITDWYYAPETVESVTAECEDELVLP